MNLILRGVKIIEGETMKYGYDIDKKVGILEFTSTKSKIILSEKEKQEFDEWLRIRRVFQ